MSNRLVPRFALGLFALLAGPVSAHHSLTEIYERYRSIELTGTVIRVDWINPHATLLLNVLDEQGAVVEWLVEMDPPHVLARRGWNPGALTVGEVVTVSGNRSLDGSPRTAAQTVMLANGEVLEASTPGSRMWAPLD